MTPIARYSSALADIQHTAETLNRAVPHLICVSKYHPIAAIRELYESGARHFGENYAQELAEKRKALASLDITWHFIGSLQSRKAKTIAANADWVHSVDRVKLVEKLAAARSTEQPPLNVCIQVNVSADTNKGGAVPSAVADLAARIAQYPSLQLHGLMLIGQITEDNAVRTKEFSEMRALFDNLRATLPSVDTLSMGMSDDWPLALEYGATHIRLGTRLFGPRPTPSR